MKELSQELLERTAILLIIIGVILFLLGVAGGIVTSVFALPIGDSVGRIITTLIGFVLIGFGIYLTWLEQKQPQQDKFRRSKRISEFLTQSYPDLTELLRKAKQVSIEGSTLMSTVNRYRTEFIQLLQRGGDYVFL